MFGLENGDVVVLTTDEDENLVRYESVDNKTKRRMLGRSKGISGNILFEKRKTEMVTCPTQDERFNSIVDIETTLPVIFHPIYKFDEDKLEYKYFGVIELLSRGYGNN
jgi:bifunctional DNA-binding transcriptional regulator/antitoxin component of YhaV-PrlF toxin-antitoxin module